MTKIQIKRIAAFVIDWILVLAVSIILFLSGPRFNADYLLYPSIEMFSAYGVILGLLSFIFLPLFKDCIFRKVSLGKLIMGLRIVDLHSDSAPSVAKLVLRNITFYIPFIELIMLLVNHGTTLGDMLSKTTVVEK